MRKFSDLSSALSDFLKEYDKDLWSEFIISSNWSKIGGKRKFSSLKLRNGVLKISTPDATLRNFIINQKNYVIDRINEILGEKIVNEIDVFGVDYPVFKMFSHKLKSKEQGEKLQKKWQQKSGNRNKK